jgi:hypothetical protein
MAKRGMTNQHYGTLENLPWLVPAFLWWIWKVKPRVVFPRLPGVLWNMALAKYGLLNWWRGKRADGRGA